MTSSTKSGPIKTGGLSSARHIGAGAVLLLVAACGSQPNAGTTNAREATDPSGAYPVTVADCGEELSIDEKPERVLSIGSASVSLLDAAGASDTIAGRAGEFGASLPDNLASPPINADIIDPADPSAEAIIGAGVDLVYGYGLFNAKPEALSQAGIETLTVSGECGHDATSEDSEPIGFAAVTDDIRRLGKVFDTGAIAEDNADDLDARVAELAAQAGDRSIEDDAAAWLYYFSSADPLSTYGGASMANAILDGAGLTNAFGGKDDSYLTISVESLLKADPEWLVLSYGLYGDTESEAMEKLLAEPGVSNLTAVRQNRVIMVPGVFSEPSPQAVEGLKLVVEATLDAG
ncbi:MAG: ABC transporter substrate-binding protein [Nocardioides sp.]